MLRASSPALLAVCLLSFALHLAYAFSPLAEINRLPMDEALYWDLARNLAEQHRFALSTDAFSTVAAGEPTLFWTPGYPLLLAFLLKCGNAYAAALLKVTQALLAAAAPLLLRPVAARLLPRGPAKALLIVAAFYPYYFQLSAQVASENLALFLGLAALALALGSERPGPRRFAGLGAVLAALCLTRPEFLVFSGLLIAWTCARTWSLWPQGRYRLPALLLAAYAAGMAPWLIRNAAIAGAPIFTTRSGYSQVFQNEYIYLYSQGKVRSEAEWNAAFPPFDSELERYRYLKRRARGFMREHPGAYALLCAKRLVSLLLPYEAKAALYRLSGRKDAKEAPIPPWFRLSNGFFLLGLWGLVLPSAVRFARKARGRLDWRSPPALLALILLGQAAVYFLFAYVEYQRSILDLHALLLGAALWSAAGGRDGEAAAITIRG